METCNCPKCGEENPAEAVMCWACYTPLRHGGQPFEEGAREYPTQNCPKCGEENPAEAVMCWACYTILGASQPAPAEEIPLGAKIRDWLSDAAPYLGVVGLAAHGWLPRKMRLSAVGAAVVAVGGPMLLNKWKSRAMDEQIDAIDEDSDKPPIERIAETILYCAVREKVTEVRIEAHERGLRVLYRIEGEWREQMEIPLYVWQPLRQQLLSYARQGEFDASSIAHLSSSPVTLQLTEFSAQLEANAQGETLHLQFQECAPDEFETNLRAIVRDHERTASGTLCASCHSFNPPRTAWCWNCGDDLQRQISALAARANNESVATALFCSGMALIGSSGWCSRRARLPVLGAGALSCVAPLVWEKLDERQKRRGREYDEKRGITRSVEPTCQRLANLILLRAIQGGIPEIRLQENGNVIVSYAVEGQWHQDAILPAYTWLALRNFLLKRARENTSCQGKTYEIGADLNGDAKSETLVLRFDDAI